MIGRFEIGIRGVFPHRHCVAVSGGRTDQGRATHYHGDDGVGDLCAVRKLQGFKLVRQFGLVDDVNGNPILIRPNRAIGAPENVHAPCSDTTSAAIARTAWIDGIALRLTIKARAMRKARFSHAAL